MEYKGDYKAETLIDVLEKKLRPAYVELDSESAITEFSKKERVAIVGLFDDRESTGFCLFSLARVNLLLEFQKFAEVATKLKEEFLFGLCVANKDVNVQFKVAPPAALFFKSFDEGVVPLEGNKFAELEDWIYVHKYPLVVS